MKIADFFEKHVQWIALGLAGIWLLWVGWSYGVNRPELDLGGTKFSPGSVDEYIRDTDAAALTSKIGNNSVPPGLIDVPDFSEAFVNSMNGHPVAPMSAIVVNSPPPYQEVVVRDTGGKKPIKGSVRELPEITAPTDAVATAGRSQVVVEPPKVVVGGGANNGANGANNAEGAARPSIFDNNAPQPQVQPAAAVPAAAPLPGQPAGTQMDKTWVSVFAKLNFTDQDSKFAKANIPPSLMQKQYIEVQLQRQEVLPDGTFGTIEVVKGLPRNQPPVDRAKPAEFVKWSLDPEAQKLILAPPFYFVIKGTAWEIPHKETVAVVQNQQDFNLQQKYQEYKQLKTQLEKNKFSDGWTNEQKAAFYNYRIEQDKLEQKAKAPPPSNNRNPAGGGGGTRTAPGGPGGRGGGAV